MSIDQNKGEKHINYPYLPEGQQYNYVPASNPYMTEAKAYALEHSLDRDFPTASVVVQDGVVIGQAANGSDYHTTKPCERKLRGSPSGQEYELCEGCHPKNHSEVKAVAQARANGLATEGADLYLWGHWWCCQPCWDAMLAGGIKNVYLLEGSEITFNQPRTPKVSPPVAKPQQ